MRARRALVPLDPQVARQVAGNPAVAVVRRYAEMTLVPLHIGILDGQGHAAGPRYAVTLLSAVVGLVSRVLRRPQDACIVVSFPGVLDGYAARAERAARGGSLRAISPARCAQRTLADNATAARLILALGLVLGLLTFPTACRCGADLPHEHALFQLPGHHHGGHSTASASSAGSASDYDGPVLRAPDGPAAIGQPVTLAVQLLAYPLLRLLRSTLPFSDVLPDGLAIVPDPPPPRA